MTKAHTAAGPVGFCAFHMGAFVWDGQSAATPQTLSFCRSASFGTMTLSFCLKATLSPLCKSGTTSARSSVALHRVDTMLGRPLGRHFQTGLSSDPAKVTRLLRTTSVRFDVLPTYIACQLGFQPLFSC